MKEETKNRRVKYTITALRNALVQLLHEEHISRISVKAICELADINRSTFYAHFNDQYSLLHHIEQEVLNNIKEYLLQQDFDGSRPITHQVLCRILEYARANVDLFKVLFSENCGPGIQKEFIGFSQIAALKLNKKYNKRVLEYLSLYATIGTISLLRKWLYDGMIESEEQMAEYIMQAIYSGMSSFE